MSATTVESENKFRELIPQLVEAYSVTSQEDAPGELAKDAIALAPVNYSLSERLAGDLPTRNFTLTTSHNELARSVSDCAAFLADRQKDVRDFAELICYHAVQIQVKGQTSPQTRAAALESARKPLLKAINQFSKPLPPLLTAELIAQPLPVVQSRTNEWVQNACQSIATQLLMSLHVLVERNVVGIIEWPGASSCKLHFFRHVVTQDQIQSKESERVSTKTNADSTRQQTVEKWEQTKGRNVFSVERHEHHVMNAEVREPDNTKNPVPQDHKQFLDRIPVWIRKYVGVLEGDLILEKVVTTDIRKESFQSKPVRHSIHEETLPAIRTTYEYDPAILLGHFVLTGWTQKEIDKEQHRRDRIAAQPAPPETDCGRKEAGQRYQSLAPYSVACVIGAALMMLFSRLQHTVMIPMALLMSTGSVVLSGYCFGLRSRWLRMTVDSLYVTAATAAVALGLLAVQCGLYWCLYGKSSLLGLSILLAIVAQIVWRIAEARKPN